VASFDRKHSLSITIDTAAICDLLRWIRRRYGVAVLGATALLEHMNGMIAEIVVSYAASLNTRLGQYLLAKLRWRPNTDVLRITAIATA